MGKRPRSRSLSLSLNLKSRISISAMGKRGGKRRRLESKAAISSAEKPQSSRKVGIFCHSMKPKKGGYYEVKLYVVDVDLKSRFETAAAVPAVRFIFPIRSTLFAVCVLKFTVYMFGGYHPFPRKPSKVKEKYARKFALTEEQLSCDGNLQVKEEQLDRIPVMNYPKAYPLALPTPNGEKILVFATHIVLKKSSRAFELFDPKSYKWEKLPGLPYCCSDGRFTQMRCYSFIDEFHFFLELEAGSYILDLIEKTWSRVRIKSVPADYGLCNFVTAKGEYVLTSGGGAYRLADGGFLSSEREGIYKRFYGGGPRVVPLSVFPPPNTPDYLQQYSWPSIVRLHPNGEGEGEGEEEEEVCETCILQVETTTCTEGSEGRLLLDVCSTKLTSFMPTTVSNSVSLRIDFLKDLYSIVLISL